MVSLTCISLDLIVSFDEQLQDQHLESNPDLYFYFFLSVMETLGDKPHLAINLHIS